MCVQKHRFYIFLLFLSYACGNNKSNDAPLVFLYNEAAGIASLDPADAISLAHIRIQSAIYQTLTDAKGNGVLADSLISPDEGLNWYVYLKAGILFHPHPDLPSGYKLEAKDVVATLDRIRQSSRLNWLLDGVKFVRAETSYLVHIEMEQPDLQIPAKLASPFSAIIPEPLATSQTSDLRFSPCGTGPFFLHKWIPGERLILHRFPDFPAYINAETSVKFPDALTVSFLKDGQTMLLEFLSGRLDGLPGLNPAYSNHLLGEDGKLETKVASDFQFLRFPFLNTEYIGFNLSASDHPILQNSGVRSIMAASIRMQELLNALRSGIGIPADVGMVPPEISFNSESPNPFLAGIHSSLQQSGIPPLKEWPVIKIHTDANHSDLISSIVSGWQALGIPVQIQLEDRAGLKAGIARGRFSIFKASWIADFPDARNYYQLFLEKNKIPAGANYTTYSSEAFQRAYSSGEWEKLDSILVADMPVIPLYYDESVWFLQNKWQGMTVDPLGRPDFSALHSIRFSQ
jgi:ABC-type transport system substrate-binding protein